MAIPAAVPFVRKTMLDPEPPPAREAGAAKWLRENLFSSWGNAALTLVSLALIYWVLSHIGPWFTRSVWDAGSLAECRQILTERYGPGTNAACFAVIVERWPQLLFGFYPPEFYWRPVLTLALFFVAAAPILFSNLPRQMLYFTMVFPAVAYWLLWGGSLWMPLMILVGLALMLPAFRYGSRVNSIVGLLAAVAAPLIWWGFIDGWITQALSSVIPLELTYVPSNRFGGFMLSLIIGISGIVLSLPLGILLALGRRSDLVLVKSVCVGFIEFIRGVPLITLLFTASLLLNYFLPPGTNFDIILRVIIMVTLFSAAYMAEVIRGGLAALPKGQYEAADALGLDYWKAQRLIVMPQALKISIPGIVNTFIGLFKDTTLVVFIGLLDPIGLSNAIRADTAWNGVYWELFIFIGLCFFIFCFGMSRYSMYLERRLKTDHR